MKIIRFITSFLLLIHSSSSFIIPSLSFSQMSKPMNSINYSTIRRISNNNNNNNHNKSKIYKIEFDNNDKINDYDENLIKLTILCLLYAYVNYWLIYKLAIIIQQYYNINDFIDNY